MAEQERDAELDRLVSRYGMHCWEAGERNRESLPVNVTRPACRQDAIHARVAELVAKAREEGRREGAKDLAKLDKDLAWEAKMGDRK